MIGLILVFFIGKSFYQLAKEFNKRGWLYVVLAIVVYYSSTFLFGIAVVLIQLGLNGDFIESSFEGILNIISIPFGLLGCWFFHKQLKKAWSKEIVSSPLADQLVHEFGQTKSDQNFE